MKKKCNCENCFWSIEEGDEMTCEAFAGRFGQFNVTADQRGCHNWEAFSHKLMWWLEVLVIDAVEPADITQRTIDGYRKCAKLNADNPNCNYKDRNENMRIYQMSDEEIRKYISEQSSPYVVFDSFSTKEDAESAIEEIKLGKQHGDGKQVFLTVLELKEFISKVPLSKN